MERSFEAGGYYADSLETINLGRFGVILFFLISGFVIPPTIKSVPTFAVNRAFRLLPALWLSIAVLLVLGVSDARLSDVPLNMIMLAWCFDVSEVSSVYWTLSVELAFYVFCAAMFHAGYLERTVPIALIAIALAFISVVTGNERWLFGTVLLAGILIHKTIANGDVGPLLAGVTIAFVGASVSVAFRQGPGFLSTVPMLSGMLMPLPVFALALAFRDQPVWWPFVYLGTISYSVYLFQDLALKAVPASLIGPVLACALIIPIATAVYHLVEAPMIAFGRRLNRSAAPARSIS